MSRVTRRAAAAATATLDPAATPAPAPAPPAVSKRASKKAQAQAQSADPLDGCIIALSGTFPGYTQNAIHEVLIAGGAQIGKIGDITHLIATPQEYAKQTSKILAAQANNVPILELDWALESIEKSTLLPVGSFSLKQPAKKRPIAAVVKNSSGSGPAAKDGDEEPQTKKRKASGSKKGASNGDTEAEKPAPKKKVPAVDTQVVKKPGKVIQADGMIERSDRKGLIVHTDPVSSVIFDVSLNQTNAKANHNKFYLIQLVVDPKKDKYFTWTRWGRVGETGQHALLGDGSLNGAIEAFEKKFKDKSGLAWANRLDPPKAGKYTFVDKSYESDEEDEESAGSPAKVDNELAGPVDCTLEKPVRELVELIFNQNLFNSAMQDLQYDANKLPLGKLGKLTISRGFQTLKDLSKAITDNAGAEKIEELSNLFYSLIPHAFGRNNPPIITDDIMLKKELKLLESLSDMKAAEDIMKAHTDLSAMHQLDRQFRGLGLQEMTVLSPKSAEYSYLVDYLQGSRGATHSWSYKVTNVFRIERNGERDRFAASKFAKGGSDRRLLWHGSRCTNFGGILSQGLRIAPPEAPVSGYMFGKGIYLADMSSKSAGYCNSYASNGEALMLLCEAELGTPMQKLTNAAYNAGETAAKGGMSSTWGVGRNGPSKWIDAGVVHPSLKGIKMPDINVAPGATNEKNATLHYNEYICYNVAQVQLRYLFRIKMGGHR